MNIKLNHSSQKFVFLLLITAIYTVLVIKFDFLQGIPVKDEPHFWETSITLSDNIIPSLSDLRDYKELNTPLPFIIFGALDNPFNQGIFAGRLLNIVLSLIIVFIIGWPSKTKGSRAIVCAIGLFASPYFLLSSAALVTDIIACLFVLLGFVAYVRDRHFLSGIAFILAVASRQYMLAFPVAIALYELIIVFAKLISGEKLNLSQHWRWIAPSVAALSILGWFYVFQGLAPSTGIEEMAPKIQKTTWFINPNRAIYFLAFTTIFIVIPEFVLFQPLTKLKALKHQSWRKIGIIAAVWLGYCLVFIPPTSSEGMFSIVLDLLHYEVIKIALFYVLSLLACIRFAQPNLMLLCILTNCIIMMKAHYWSKYVLPLAVVFWYLKSLNLERKFSFGEVTRNPVTKQHLNVEQVRS